MFHFSFLLFIIIFSVQNSNAFERKKNVILDNFFSYTPKIEELNGRKIIEINEFSCAGLNVSGKIRITSYQQLSRFEKEYPPYIAESDLTIAGIGDVSLAATGWGPDHEYRPITIFDKGFFFENIVPKKNTLIYYLGGTALKIFRYRNNTAWWGFRMQIDNGRRIYGYLGEDSHQDGIYGKFNPDIYDFKCQRTRHAVAAKK